VNTLLRSSEKLFAHYLERGERPIHISLTSKGVRLADSRNHKCIVELRAKVFNQLARTLGSNCPSPGCREGLLIEIQFLINGIILGCSKCQDVKRFFEAAR
jgi:hypothetical protein